MTATFTPPVPGGHPQAVVSHPPGLTALGAVVVGIGRIAVGLFGIEGIEPFLDGLAQICLLYFVLALWLGSFVETLIVPEHLWKRAGQNWGVFVVLILLLPVLGALLYLAIARPALRRAALSV